MKQLFNNKGLIVLGFGDKPGRTVVPHGKLEVCQYSYGKKFYKLTLNKNNGFWVDIISDYVEPLFGCKVVEERSPTCSGENPVSLIMLNDIALIRIYRDGEGSYWIFRNGDYYRVAKEWLLYHALIPGVAERDIVDGPPQTPGTIQDILTNLIKD
jgi:hypothetical protein